MIERLEGAAVSQPHTRQHGVKIGVLRHGHMKTEPATRCNPFSPVACAQTPPPAPLAGPGDMVHPADEF